MAQPIAQKDFSRQWPENRKTEHASGDHLDDWHSFSFYTYPIYNRSLTIAYTTTRINTIQRLNTKLNDPVDHRAPSNFFSCSILPEHTNFPFQSFFLWNWLAEPVNVKTKWTIDQKKQSKYKSITFYKEIIKVFNKFSPARDFSSDSLSSSVQTNLEEPARIQMPQPGIQCQHRKQYQNIHPGTTQLAYETSTPRLDQHNTRYSTGIDSQIRLSRHADWLQHKHQMRYAQEIYAQLAD